jgi:hypothetical protein
MAILMPPSWLCILLATASPAASSAALLIRKPDESRSIDVCIRSAERVAYVRASSAPTLVLIIVIVSSSACYKDMILEDPNDPYLDLFRKKIKFSQKKTPNGAFIFINH